MIGTTALIAAVFMVIFVAASSANLSGSTFEGNDGNLVHTGSNLDWDNVTPRATGTDRPSGNSDDAFGQGAKEDTPATTVVDGSIPPNKNDLTRFYEASQQTANGTIFLYLGWERAVNTGSANLDFEINKNPTLGWDANTTGPLTINRTAGDMLVTYDFGGSGAPTLGLLRWVTSGNTNQCFSANALPCWGNRVNLSAAGFAEGAVNTGTIAEPIAGGNLGTGLFGEAAINLTAAGVFQPNVCSAFGSTFIKSRSSSSFTAEVKDFIAPVPVTISNCSSITIRKVTENGNDTFGYTTTGSGLSSFNLTGGGTPQTFSPLQAGSYSVTENLTSAQTTAGWGLKTLTCTTTGSGTSYTTSGATANITLGLGGTADCTYTNHINLSPSIATLLASSTINAGQSTNDTATLTGGTANAGGTVKYVYYTQLSDCTSSQTYASPGGTLVDTVTVNNGTVPASQSQSFSGSGTYYWRAFYSGDANNNPAKSGCSEEPLLVKANPTITTLLAATTINAGGSTNDTAALSGNTSDAGGTVKYVFYSQLSDCTSGQTYASPGGTLVDTVTVTNGVVPPSQSQSFANFGTYYWRAFYSGDGKNNTATSGCGEEPLLVKANPTIATLLAAATINAGQSTNDTSTLTGATSDAGGSVKYVLYSSLGACDPAATYASPGGTLVSTVTVNNGAVPNSTSQSFPNFGTYYWRAFYSGDTKNNPAKSGCSEEPLLVKANPTIATLLAATTINAGQSTNDTATLTGATANAGGHVKYVVYASGACLDSQTYASPGGTLVDTVTVTNGIVPASQAQSFANFGTYYWRAFYEGDANNNPAKSGCSEEPLLVKANPTIGTVLSATSVAVGSSVYDTSTLTGATSDASGTVTYTVFTDTGCSQGAQNAGTKDVTNGNVPNSDPITFNVAGDYYWQAVYSGDSKNNGATSVCTSEHLIVNKKSPGNSTAQHLTPNDSFMLSGGFNPTGTITWNLYSPSDDTCSGTPAFTQTVSVSGNGKYDTTNTSFIASVEGTWRWQAVYSGDINNQSSTSTCGTERFTIANS